MKRKVDVWMHIGHYLERVEGVIIKLNDNMTAGTGFDLFGMGVIEIPLAFVKSLPHALVMIIAEGQGDLVSLFWPVNLNTCIRRTRQHRECLVFSCIPTLSPLLIERLVLDRFDSPQVIFLRPP